MKVAGFECFVITHHLSPRTGPSIAYSSEHAYVLVRLQDDDGVVGWGETYRTPGTLDTVEAVCRALLDRDESLRDLIREARWVGGGLAGDSPPRQCRSHWKIYAHGSWGSPFRSSSGDP